MPRSELKRRRRRDNVRWQQTAQRGVKLAHHSVVGVRLLVGQTGEWQADEREEAWCGVETTRARLAHVDTVRHDAAARFEPLESLADNDADQYCTEIKHCIGRHSYDVHAEREQRRFCVGAQRNGVGQQLMQCWLGFLHFYKIKINFISYYLQNQSRNNTNFKLPENRFGPLNAELTELVLLLPKPLVNHRVNPRRAGSTSTQISASFTKHLIASYYNEKNTKLTFFFKKPTPTTTTRASS
jgi:hypothetical protein